MLRGGKKEEWLPIPDTIIFKGLRKKQLFGWQCKNIREQGGKKKKIPYKDKGNREQWELIAFFRINLASCTKFILTVIHPFNPNNSSWWQSSEALLSEYKQTGLLKVRLKVSRRRAQRCPEPAALDSVTPSLVCPPGLHHRALAARPQDCSRKTPASATETDREKESSTNNSQISPPRSRYTWFLKSRLLSQP